MQNLMLLFQMKFRSGYLQQIGHYLKGIGLYNITLDLIFCRLKNARRLDLKRYEGFFFV